MPERKILKYIYVICYNNTTYYMLLFLFFYFVVTINIACHPHPHIYLVSRFVANKHPGFLVHWTAAGSFIVSASGFWPDVFVRDPSFLLLSMPQTDLLQRGKAPVPYPSTFMDVWDDVHVKMPCSKTNLFPVVNEVCTNPAPLFQHLILMSTVLI